MVKFFVGNDDFVSDLREELGKENRLNNNKGLIHDYLGIIIDYLLAGKAVFTMYDYLEDVFVKCPEDLKNGMSIYSASNNLFMVGDYSTRLSKE